MHAQLLTRSELADLITTLRGDTVTTRQVGYNEAKWGLKAARGRDISRSCVRYNREIALAALRVAGVIPN